MTRPLDLLESAALLGRMRYVELAAFERLGRRARHATSAAFATWVAGAALAHAYRAGLLEDHLPVAAGLPGAAQLTVSPGGDVEAALGLLGPAPDEARPPVGPGAGTGATPPTGDDAELLVGLTDAFYPAMLAGYEARLALASPASDPPLRRTLERVVFDLSAVLETGRRLAGGRQTLPRRPVTEAGDLAARLARHLARGGPFGPIGQDRATP